MLNITKKISANTNKRMYEFLKENSVGTLSTVNNSTEPHASVVYYNIDENESITFITKQNTRKANNIKQNSNVVLSVYEPVSQTVVQLEGAAELISSLTESQRAFKAMVLSARQTSDSGIPPISKLKSGHYLAYRVVPRRMTMMVYARPDPGGYEMFDASESFSK